MATDKYELNFATVLPVLRDRDRILADLSIPAGASATDISKAKVAEIELQIKNGDDALKKGRPKKTGGDRIRFSKINACLNLRPEPPESNIHQFRVVLLGISPLIWRRLLVRSDSTIADLQYPGIGDQRNRKLP
jgi:hypothetical protein